MIVGGEGGDSGWRGGIAGGRRGKKSQHEHRC